MCRLFAVIGKHIPIKPLLQEFKKLAMDGKVPPGKEPGHHHGWGIGMLSEEGISLTKNHVSASTDPKLEQVIINQSEQFSGILMGHLRKASKGSVTSENNHPFQRDSRLFMHNGTVNYLDLEGSDSVRYFSDLISLSGNGSQPNFKAFHEKLHDEEIKYSSITAAYSTPESISLLRCVAQTPEYYTMYYQTHPDYIIFCQEPLNEGVWEEVRLGEIVTVSFPSLAMQKNIL